MLIVFGFPEVSQQLFCVLEKLLFGLQYAKEKKLKYGFPHNICVQTNGYFAQNEREAIKYLALFYKNGANEIDITSNDVFHFEQMDSCIPERLATIANRMGVFETVSIGGSDYKVVKRFGRAKSISKEELKDFDMKYTYKCVFTGTDFVIHPNGNVLPCIYGFDNVYGNIYKKSLSKIVERERNRKVSSLLSNDGVHSIEDIIANCSHMDICDACNNYFNSCKEEDLCYD